MHLEFVPVEKFYFALTLAVRTLEEIDDPALAESIGEVMAQRYGQSSTVAAASQNTYNYVFEVVGIDNSPNPRAVVSIADWQGKLRIGSDYGWAVDANRKPIRTEKFEQRSDFAHQLKLLLQDLLEIPLPMLV